MEINEICLSLYINYICLYSCSITNSKIVPKVQLNFVLCDAIRADGNFEDLEVQNYKKNQYTMKNCVKSITEILVHDTLIDT